MKKLVGVIALMCGFIAVSHATENSVNKPLETKTDSAQSQSTIGDDVRQAGREIKEAGRKVRRAVVTRCGDGRHTVRGKAACAGHGGVSAQN
ncbi:MAG: hypothetical protein WCL27_14420 [Betaproteobacteria bacterium]